jgi:YesN/AraC family two-component response regulator
MDLWGRIVKVLENEGRWRDPNLGLTSLSDELKSNRTYIGDAFKQNTGLTFVEYITKRRIDYVVGELKQNPQADIWDLFVYVGYGQRTTAMRNFKKITGTTPSEFIKGLK